MTTGRTAVLRIGDPSRPAVDLEKVRGRGGLDMTKKTEAAAASLRQRGLLGRRFAVILLIDRSGSMKGAYRDGTVQTLVDRALAFALAVDDDGSIPVGLYGGEFTWTLDVTLDNYAGIVAREGWRAKGTTNLTDAVAAAREIATGTTDPVYLLVVTDGSPDNQKAATEQIIATAAEPVFVKFLLIGHSRPGREYCELLDDLETERGRRKVSHWMLPMRALDNVDTQLVPEPSALTDAEFAEVMAEEVDTWLAAAIRAGLVR